MAVAIPERIEDIDAEWIDAILREAGVAMDGRVAAIEPTRIGVEIGFLSQTFRVAVTYEGGTARAPGSLVVKLEPTAAVFRDAERGIKAFEREIRFYQEIAPRVTLRLPRVFHAAVSPQSSLLVMEDLSALRHVDQIHGLRQAEVMGTVRQIAKLHAAFWGHTDEPTLRWIPAYDHFWEDGFAKTWPTFAEAYELRIGPEGVRLGERIAAQIDALMDRLRSRTATVIHADLRADNLLFAADDAVILDWQLVTRSLAAIDVARVLAGSEPPAERRGHQFEIFATWHEALLAAGVDDYPLEQALDDFRLALLYTLLIPIRSFGLVGPDAGSRTLRLVDCQADRIFAAAVELDAGRALD
jgi:tRNA A-37 threonylcarbamoyl transferase component Bud32